MKRIKDEKHAGAVLIATHHPPFVYSAPPSGHGAAGNHGSSSDMLREIDAICTEADVYPHAVKPVVKSTHLQLDKYDDHDYGYLRISADAKQLRIAYHQCGTRSLLQSRYDLVTIDLATHDLLAN